MKGNNTVTLCKAEMVEIVQEGMDRRFTGEHRARVVNVRKSGAPNEVFEIDLSEDDRDYVEMEKYDPPVLELHRPMDVTYAEGGVWTPWEARVPGKPIFAIRYIDGTVFDVVGGWRTV